MLNKKLKLSIKKRFNYLFKPYILTLLTLIIGYTFIHWVVFIELNLFHLNEVITNFVFPIILTGLACLFTIRPRFKILKLEAKHKNWIDFYSSIVWISMTIPVILAQEFMVEASGDITELNSINSINKSKLTKYYTIREYYIDKKIMGVNSVFDVSGRYNESFNMYIYITIPIFSKSIDTNEIAPGAWLGILYEKSISNKLKLDEKEKQFKRFVDETQKEFYTKNVSDFLYLKRLWDSDKRQYFIEAVKSNPRYKPNEIIFEPINESLKSRSANKLVWVLESSIMSLIIWFIMILVPKINVHKLRTLEEGNLIKKNREDLLDFIHLLLPRESYFITPILIYINIFIYILMATMGYGVITFKVQDLVLLGANYGPYARGGDWWRLLTNIFLHDGLFHITTNICALLMVGLFLEPILGKLKYFIVYIFTGITASIASIYWYEASISYGSSGAIFGLFGVLLSLLLKKTFQSHITKSFLINIIFFVGFSFLMGLIGTVDNAAHIGGTLSGFIIGLFMNSKIKK